MFRNNGSLIPLGSSVLEVAEYMSDLAEECFNDNSPGKTFYYYCLALGARPDWRGELKTRFSSALCAWGKILEHEEKYDDLFSCYEKALELYPENELILNNLGAHLCRLEQPIEALNYFKKALEINDDYLPAYINVQVTKSILVERWHFRMLNDSIRNESYRKAIAKRVNKTCESVLDIGSGTGLLSMYAKMAGANMVYGCDYSETMTSISCKVLLANGLLDSVKVINKLSTCLSVPDDIPDRVSLVVTETFDGGLLGEHILETLIHAWEKLLKPLSSEVPQRVIPSGSVLYIAPIECLQIARKNFIINSPRLARGSFVSGLDLSCFKCCSKFDEPYDTENLKSLECSYLSPPEKLFQFDFNNYSDLKKYFDGEILQKFTINITNDCYVDAFAVWFDLILDDEITITSSPLSEMRSCWEQAIFPLNKERFVPGNSTFSLSVSCQNGIVKVNSSDKLLHNENTDVVSVPQALISVLNCDSLLMTYIRTFEEIKSLFGSDNISVLDLSVCPYLGALIAQNLNSKVLFSNQSNELLDGSKELLSSLDVRLDNMTSVEWGDILMLFKDKNETFNVIIMDVLERTGQISEEAIGMMPLLKELLKSGGLLIPSKLQIWCQLVFSEELINSSEVKSSEDHLHIAEYINEYKVSHMLDFNLHDTRYEEVSESFMVASLDLQNAASEMVFEKEVLAFKNSPVNGVIYWYCSEYFKSISFSTFSLDSHINHAAALLDAPVNLNMNTKLLIKLQYNSGGMRFSLKT